MTGLPSQSPKVSAKWKFSACSPSVMHCQEGNRNVSDVTQRLPSSRYSSTWVTISSVWWTDCRMVPREMGRDVVEAATSPEAWVCTVALNIARRRWRRRSIADRLLGRDHHPSPDIADVGAANADLYRAIRALPDLQREAVFLHYLADQSIDEVSANTGSPVGTVKSRLARGRAALAEQLTSPPRDERPDPVRNAREGTRTS